MVERSRLIDFDKMVVNKSLKKYTKGGEKKGKQPIIKMRYDCLVTPED